MKQRGSVSISGEVYARLIAHCRAEGITVSALVEDLVDDVISGRVPIPVPADPVASLEISAKAKEEYRASVLKAVSAARDGAGLARRIEIPISHDLMADVRAQIERGDGRSPEQIFESAVVRMLDHLESVPVGSLCALCTGQIDGCARQLPLGRGDALVWVCYTCDTEHPRKGRYAYDGGKDKGQKTGVMTSGRDSNGNRQKGNGIR